MAHLSYEWPVSSSQLQRDASCAITTTKSHNTHYAYGCCSQRTAGEGGPAALRQAICPFPAGGAQLHAGISHCATACGRKIFTQKDRETTQISENQNFKSAGRCEISDINIISRNSRKKASNLDFLTMEILKFPDFLSTHRGTQLTVGIVTYL